MIVPSPRQVSRKEPGPFDVRNFTYDRENDCYICPKGAVLAFRKVEVKRRRKVYLGCAPTCRVCEHFGICTSNRRHGRKVTRLLKEDSRRKFERQYALAESKETYKKRKQKVELPFGHIKHNLGVRGFLLRGLAGVKAEFSIMASCFNITRMIRLLGVERLVAILKAMAIPGNIVGLSAAITATKHTCAAKLFQVSQFEKIIAESNHAQPTPAA